MSRKKAHLYKTGGYGSTVTVVRRQTGGNLYLRYYDPEARSKKGGPRWKSLGHQDIEKAAMAANRLSEKLARDGKLETEPATLLRVFKEYLKHKTPSKAQKGRNNDRRCAELWLRVLGKERDPHLIRREEWEKFISERGQGIVDARGCRATTPSPVGARTVQKDLQWLKIVLRWASRWHLPEGRYLMRQDPTRGFKAPREKNPDRPVATSKEFQALLEVADQVSMEFRWDGKRTKTTSFFKELLVIANDTGARISAICQLTWEDVSLDAPRPDGLAKSSEWWGLIRWPADTDKKGKERVTPMTRRVHDAFRQVALRCAIERQRTDVGPSVERAVTPVFPTAENRFKPLNNDQASTWARKAAKLAGIKWPGWHSFRRKFASDRRHLPATDVAAAGGWSDIKTMQRCYQHADMDGLVNVVNLSELPAEREEST